MKEQNNATARDLSETDITRLLENLKQQSRIFVGLEKRMEDFREVLTTEIKESEMKNAITEIGNRLDKMNARLEEAEGWINDIENKIMENKPNKRITEHENRFREFSDSIKHNNTHKSARGRERKKGRKLI